jgi:uncharacterized membrane protein
MHPMLVMFPTALFPLLVVLDALHLAFGDAAFWTVGFWVAALGVLTTLAAMVPGTIDMRAIPDGTKAHRTGLYHAIVGTAVLVAYALALWMRWPAGSAPEGVWAALAVDVLGVALVSAQGWLGGELVYRHHVGVLSAREGADPVVLATGADAVPLPDDPRHGASDARRRDVDR